jgi:hypothetical protein
MKKLHKESRFTFRLAQVCCFITYILSTAFFAAAGFCVIKAFPEDIQPTSQNLLLAGNFFALGAILLIGFGILYFVSKNYFSRAAKYIEEQEKDKTTIDN